MYMAQLHPASQQCLGTSPHQTIIGDQISATSMILTESQPEGSRIKHGEANDGMF